MYTEMLERERRPTQKRTTELEPPLKRTDGVSSSHSSQNVIKIGGMVKRVSPIRHPAEKSQSLTVSDCISLIRWKTITVSTNDGDFHVVSYAARDDILAGRLNTIANTAEIATIYLDPSHFLLARFRYPPTVTVDKCGSTIIM